MIVFEGRDIAVPSVIKRISKEKVELGLKFSRVPVEVERCITTYIEQTILFVEK